MLFEVICLFTLLVACLLFYITSLNNKKEHITLSGKHVVVTGGSSGIGYDLSMEAFAQGANVSIIARNKVNFYLKLYLIFFC